MENNYIDGDYLRELSGGGVNGASRPMPQQTAGAPSVQARDPRVAIRDTAAQTAESVVEEISSEPLGVDDCIFAVMCAAIDEGDSFDGNRLAEELEMLEDLTTSEDPRIALSTLALRLTNDGSRLTGGRLIRALKRDPRFASVASEAEALMGTEGAPEALAAAAEVIDAANLDLESEEGAGYVGGRLEPAPEEAAADDELSQYPLEDQ